MTAAGDRRKDRYLDEELAEGSTIQLGLLWIMYCHVTKQSQFAGKLLYAEF